MCFCGVIPVLHRCERPRDVPRPHPVVLMSLRLLIADVHAVVRAGLCQILSGRQSDLFRFVTQSQADRARVHFLMDRAGRHAMPRPDSVSQYLLVFVEPDGTHRLLPPVMDTPEEAEALYDRLLEELRVRIARGVERPGSVIYVIATKEGVIMRSATM
jgi:hypothetical protein